MDDETASADKLVAPGSLAQMVEAFAAIDPAKVEGLIVKCAGRDRLTTLAEVRDLRVPAAA